MHLCDVVVAAVSMETKKAQACRTGIWSFPSDKTLAGVKLCFATINLGFCLVAGEEIRLKEAGKTAHVADLPMPYLPMPDLPMPNLPMPNLPMPCPIFAQASRTHSLAALKNNNCLYFW
jgi:hypothetical protein